MKPSDAVHALWATLRDEGWEAALRRHLTTDAVWDMGEADLPEPGTYHGLDAAIGFVAEWSASFESWAVELVESRDHGERAVTTWTQSGRVAGAPVAMRFWIVFEISAEGLVTRATVLQDPAKLEGFLARDSKGDGSNLDA